MPKLVVLPPQDSLRREWAGRLQEALSDFQIVEAETDGDARREVPAADAAFGRMLPEWLRLATRLRWLHSPQIAPDAGFYYAELAEHPVVVTNPRGTFDDCLGEHTLMYVLALARGLPYYMDAQRRRCWDTEARQSPYVDLASSTALVVGVGYIGREVARMCAAFGMNVLGVDARWEFDVPGVEQHTPEELDELLPQADFVLVTVPHTPRTEGMWERRRFGLMKNSAYFVNVGRGRTTRLDDLVEALKSGEIAGCGLDVFEVEPLPEEHELWSLPNVLLTPHIGAKDAESVPERQFQIFLDNARRFARNEPLRNVVDKTEWY